MLNLKHIWNYKVVKVTKAVLKKKRLEWLGLGYIAGYQDLVYKKDSFPYKSVEKNYIVNKLYWDMLDK